MFIKYNVTKLVKTNLDNALKGLFLSLLIAFSYTTNADPYKPIPLDKLVCYGQGTQQQLSPSGEFLAAMVPVDDNVCDIKDETDQEMMATDRVLVVTNLETMEPKVISGTTAGSAVTSFRWLNNEKLLVSRDSRSGIDSASLYTVDRDGKNTTLLIKAKAFRNKPGYQVPSLYGVYPRVPGKVMISLFNTGSRSRDLYWLDLKTKRTELVAREPSVPGELVTGWMLDWEGVPYGFETFMEEGPNKGIETTFYRFTDSGGYEKVISCMHQAACFFPQSFDIDNKTILGVGQAVTPEGKILNETDTNALWAIDSETGEYLEMIFHDPDYDLSSPMHGMFSMNMWFSSDGYDLYGFSYEGAKTEKVYFDEYFASVDKSLEAIFPDHEVSIRDWSDDLTRFLFRVSNDKDPGSSYLFDLSKGKVSLISEAAPWLKDYQLASMEPFTYMSRDGIKLHGYITLPPTYKEGDKIPFIIHPHGGPNARDYWGYNPEVQFYATRGYGVLQMDYRGSTGYGREEMILANHQMGKKMQEDKYDALMWANEQGYVDMDNVCISGASYGGYAAMQAATKDPDLFKCIIAYVGVYDLTSMDLRGLRWSDLGMPMEYIEKGDPRDPDDYQNLYENSPLFFAENIEDPILIITGRRDNQVRFQETVDMVNELKKYNKDYKYIIKGDEGHGFRNETANLELYQDYEEFLAKHLN